MTFCLVVTHRKKEGDSARDILNPLDKAIVDFLVSEVEQLANVREAVVRIPKVIAMERARCKCGGRALRVKSQVSLERLTRCRPQST